MLMSIPQCIVSDFLDTLSKWYDNDSLLTSISGNPSEKLHCGNVVNMPYCEAVKLKDTDAQLYHRTTWLILLPPCSVSPMVFWFASSVWVFIFSSEAYHCVVSQQHQDKCFPVICLWSPMNFYQTTCAWLFWCLQVLMLEEGFSK